MTREEKGPKVTYLLGAGASANALPIIKKGENGFNGALEEFAKRLEGDDRIREDHKPFVNLLSKELKELASNSEKFGTPDTYARYLYFTAEHGGKSLDRLKFLISVFFTSEQLFFGKLDNRYFSFLTTILDRRGFFPQNVKILNWNYDFQIQLASRFFKKESLVAATSTVKSHTPPLAEYYPTLNPTANRMGMKDEELSIVHLNGIAGFVEDTSLGVSSPAYNRPTAKGMDNEDINEIMDYFKYMSQNSKPMISFGWEDSTFPFTLARKMELAEHMIQNTEILVVLGYSFPYFNREIDRELLQKLVDGGLKKIYYQDKVKKDEFMRSQFDLPYEVDIQPIQEVDEFHIPPEL